MSTGVLIGIFFGFTVGYFYRYGKEEAKKAAEEPPLHKLHRIWHGKDWPKR